MEPILFTVSGNFTPDRVTLITDVVQIGLIADKIGISFGDQIDSGH